MIDLDFKTVVSAVSQTLPFHGEPPQMLSMPNGAGVLCNSVRLGFYLYLKSLDLPKGSEVVISAISIPEMFQIVELLGLKPIALDFEEYRVTHTVDEFKQKLGSQSRVLVLCHLFGYAVQFDSLIELAKAHNLIVIEDCAQAFGSGYKGHPLSDCVMFSFGPIKRQTAVGGAMLVLHDRNKAESLSRLVSSMPTRSELFFVRRLFKYYLIGCAIRPPMFGCLTYLCGRMGYDFNHILYSMSRAFPAGTFEKRFFWNLSRGHRRFLVTRIEKGFASNMASAKVTVGACRGYNGWLRVVFPSEAGYESAYAKIPSSLTSFPTSSLEDSRAARNLAAARFLAQSEHVSDCEQSARARQRARMN